MNLQAQYEGPSALQLDNYKDLPAPVPPMGVMHVGTIQGKCRLGYTSEFFERRAPAPFYRAIVLDQKGWPVTQLVTGAGREWAAVLCDVCHCLADGTAELRVSAQAKENTPSTVIPLSRGRNGQVVYLMLCNTHLAARVWAAVRRQMLAAEHVKAPPGDASGRLE